MATKEATRPRPVTARRRPADKHVQSLWTRYKRKPTDQLRNQLMEHYLQLVRYNAEHIATRLPDEVDTEDLVSAGVFGLKDAIDAYDPDRGAKFETFCTLRIRGAILDELRALDWVPRLVRNRSHRLREAQAGLEAELGRPPTDQEVARRLNLPPAEFDKLRADGSTVAVVPLSRRCSNPNGERERCDGDLLTDQSSRDPVKEAYKRDIKELVTRGLTRAERLILILYYYEEMTMKEIGATLDLSESRVSQMHSAILARLKQQLQARQAELVA